VTSVTRNPFNQGAVAAPEKHGPSMGMWVLLAVVVAGIALVLRWGLKRARSNEDGQADTDRRTQLKRATELLNDVRSLKLDVRLSTQPGHEAMLKEVEGIETQLRQMVEALSNSKNPVPPYAIEDLASQIDSVRARSEGRPDPRAAAPAANVNDNQSVYAQEAERFGRTPPGQPPYSPYPQQQPPVVIQQGGGGFGGGLGGLLGGVLWTTNCVAEVVATTAAALTSAMAPTTGAMAAAWISAATIRATGITTAKLNAARQTKSAGRCKSSRAFILSAAEEPQQRPQELEKPHDEFPDPFELVPTGNVQQRRQHHVLRAR
jgi:hypothetical protein